jgi:hypothetical protein
MCRASRAALADTTMTSRPSHFGRAPIRPDRVRRIDKRGFAFVPNRLLHEGFFVSMSHLERSLYLYVAARNSLIDKDLVAFDGTRFQVLSLPPQPVTRPRPPLVTQDDFEREDPATIRQLIRSSLDRR